MQKPTIFAAPKIEKQFVSKKIFSLKSENKFGGLKKVVTFAAPKRDKVLEVHLK
jgi:hypothetical protein